MAYSGVDDLLLGDIILGGGVSRTQFIDTAAEDMDAKLGWLYHLPLRPSTPVGVTPVDPQGDDPADPSNDWQALPLHEQLLLKGINNKLASGRLILTLDIAGEGTSMHAYGWQLVREATTELAVLSNGDLWLTAERSNPDEAGADDSRTPSIQNEDEESLLLGFVNTVQRSQPWYSQPGKAGHPWP